MQAVRLHEGVPLTTSVCSGCAAPRAAEDGASDACRLRVAVRTCPAACNDTDHNCGRFALPCVICQLCAHTAVGLRRVRTLMLLVHGQVRRSRNVAKTASGRLSCSDTGGGWAGATRPVRAQRVSGAIRTRHGARGVGRSRHHLVRSLAEQLLDRSAASYRDHPIMIAPSIWVRTDTPRPVST